MFLAAVGIIAFFVYLQPVSGQRSEYEVSNCQEVTGFLLRHALLRDGFYFPLTKKDFAGPTLGNEPGSIKEAADSFADSCGENGGPGSLCSDYNRVRKAGTGDSFPPNAFKFDPRSCKILQGSFEILSEPSGGGNTSPIMEAWMVSSYRELARHQRSCRDLNERHTGQGPSPYEQMVARNKKWYAQQNREAHGDAIRPLKEYLEDRCVDRSISMRVADLIASCSQSGQAPITIEKIISRFPDSMQARASGPNETSSSGGPENANPETFLLRLADWGRGAFSLDGDPFQLGPDRPKQDKTLTGDCYDCCSDEAKSNSAYLFGGPDQSIIVGEAQVSISCTKEEECGSSRGDPHMCTHDGLKYEFHGVGEFVLAKTDDFEVQARHAALGKYSALNSAAAMSYKGDRVSVYGGIPARVMVNGEEWVLYPGEVDRLPSGAILQRNGNIIRVSADGYVFEAVLRSKWVGKINVSVPPGSRSRGLLGDRNVDRKDDIRTAEGDLLLAPVGFNELYKIFGESWRVTSKTSLFDYAAGESAEGFADMEFPKRHTTLADFDAETKRKAEAACRKAGVTDGLNLEDCIYDISVTCDEEFALDSVGRTSRGVRLEMKGPALQTATSADGVKVELPGQGIASYPIDIRISGNKQPYLLLFAKPGSPIHTNAGAGTQTELKVGDELVSLHVPYTPGTYELRLITTPDRRIVTSIPFRSTPPNAEIEATETAEAGGSIDVRIVGDISPNTRIQIVRVENPSQIIAGRNLRGGLSETVTFDSLPKAKGEYEIRYVSATHLVAYAQKRLTIR